MDETLTYHPSNKRSERFSVQSFKFIGEHAFVYVHCHVRICNVSDPNSKCVRVCDDRRKRDVTLTAESLDDVYPLAQGPLSLEKGDVSRQRKGSPVKSTGKLQTTFLQRHSNTLTKTTSPTIFTFDAFGQYSFRIL